MVSIDKCYRYELEFSKPTRANSTVVDNRVITIVKKDYKGKACKSFVAYDYKTKVQLFFGSNKEELIEYLNKRKEDLKVLDGMDL